MIDEIKLLYYIYMCVYILKIEIKTQFNISSYLNFRDVLLNIIY